MGKDLSRAPKIKRENTGMMKSGFLKYKLLLMFIIQCSTLSIEQFKVNLDFIVNIEF